MNQKQLTTLALTGLSILVLFAALFIWLYYEGAVWGNGEAVLAYAPFWIYPFLIVSSVYVGFFAAIVAKGNWEHPWLWGIAGFALTLLFILALPGLLSAVFPIPGPEIFAGPAIFAFLAPILSAPLVVLFISMRRKGSV